MIKLILFVLRKRDFSDKPNSIFKKGGIKAFIEKTQTKITFIEFA
jgi:hypothetical protein